MCRLFLSYLQRGLCSTCPDLVARLTLEAFEAAAISSYRISNSRETFSNLLIQALVDFYIGIPTFFEHLIWRLKGIEKIYSILLIVRKGFEMGWGAKHRRFLKLSSIVEKMRMSDIQLHIRMDVSLSRSGNWTVRTASDLAVTDRDRSLSQDLYVKNKQTSTSNESLQDNVETPNKSRLVVPRPGCSSLTHQPRLHSHFNPPQPRQPLLNLLQLNSNSNFRYHRLQLDIT